MQPVIKSSAFSGRSLLVAHAEVWVTCRDSPVLPSANEEATPYAGCGV